MVFLYDILRLASLLRLYRGFGAAHDVKGVAIWTGLGARGALVTMTDESLIDVRSRRTSLFASVMGFDTGLGLAKLWRCQCALARMTLLKPVCFFFVKKKK